jgi:hypothetical protein
MIELFYLNKTLKFGAIKKSIKKTKDSAMLKLKLWKRRKTSIFKLMKEKKITVLTWICIIISGVFFSGTLFLILKNEGHSGGNHWFLFGTKWDKLLGNYIALAIAGSVPLTIPVFIRRTSLNLILFVLSVPLFFFLKFSFYMFTD